jgi:hypothetical protein
MMMSDGLNLARAVIVLEVVRTCRGKSLVKISALALAY